MRRHDPERDAAAYLAGEMRRRSSALFEAHLLGCEDCWKEVGLARRGRAVAESVRELSRPSLRESVRAAVALSGPPNRRLFSGLRVPLAVALVGLAFAAGGYGIDRLITSSGPAQPGEISAALDSFRSDQVPAEGAAVRPAPGLASAGLELMHSGHGFVGGQPVDVYYYRGSSGARLFVFQSPEPFPRARGAQDISGPGHRWQATEGDVSMVCGDRPMPYLVLGNQQSTVAAAASVLGAVSLTGS
jgi:hypothetical protein